MNQTVKARRIYNGALRKEQSQMTRGRVLDAARRLLVSGTYSSVTMEDIAREAGFGNRERMRRAFVRAYAASPLSFRVNAGPIAAF